MNSLAHTACLRPRLGEESGGMSFIMTCELPSSEAGLRLLQGSDCLEFSFVSDCMGHSPLIADNSFTTKLPADVDEEAFNPSSATITAPMNGEESDKDSMYFILKCRYVLLLRYGDHLSTWAYCIHPKARTVGEKRQEAGTQGLYLG